jgi:hypothetical protein
VFKSTRIALGQGYLYKYTILEIKWLCSIYFHVFNTVEQDRFHTHAFNGIAILIKGGYEEEHKLKDGVIERKQIKPGIRYIPRSYNHRLLKSKPNTVSILFTGRWQKTWTEEFVPSLEHPHGFSRTLTSGRKVIS